MWSVVLADGYVKVCRDGATVCAGVDVGGGSLRDVTFVRDKDRKANKTRQRAMRELQAAGYR